MISTYLPLFAGIALVVCLAIYLLGFANIRRMPIIVFIALIIGQVLRIRLSEGSSSALIVLDVANSLYIVCGLPYVLATKKKFPLTFALIFLIGFILWLPITLLFGSPHLSTNDLLVALFYIVRFILMALTAIITAMLFTTRQENQRLYRYFVLSGLVLLLLGYLQLIFVPDFRFMAQYGWDPHIGRLLSTFFDPNFFGMFLVMLFCFLIANVFHSQGVKRFAYYLLIVATVGAIAATFSRSAYLALLIAGFSILTFYSWRLTIVMLIAVTLIGASIPRVRTRIIGAVRVDATAQQRLQSWQDTVVIIKDNPIVGVGYNAYGPAQVRYGLVSDLKKHSSRGGDSSFLLVLATTGMIGLLLYILFLLGLMNEAVLLYRFGTEPFWRQVGLALTGIIPAYVVHSQFVNGLFYPLLFIPFAIMIAMLTVGTQNLQSKD